MSFQLREGLFWEENGVTGLGRTLSRGGITTNEKEGHIYFGAEKEGQERP